jgi:HEPN domain-containing protein
MKPLALEWIEKGGADLVSAGRECRARRLPNYDAACFFAQQSVEKHLKACLVEDDVPPPRTHDLPVLLDLLVPSHPLWEPLRPQLEVLTSYAVEFRYPGESATREMAREAVRHARRICDIIRQSLESPTL